MVVCVVFAYGYVCGCVSCVWYVCSMCVVCVQYVAHVYTCAMERVEVREQFSGVSSSTL